MKVLSHWFWQQPVAKGSQEASFILLLPPGLHLQHFPKDPCWPQKGTSLNQFNGFVDTYGRQIFF